MSTYESVRRAIVMDRPINVQERMVHIHADSLRKEKEQLQELSDAAYGHVDRKDLSAIQSRIDEINDWLKHLEYV